MVYISAPSSPPHTKNELYGVVRPETNESRGPGTNVESVVGVGITRFHETPPKLPVVWPWPSMPP